MKFAIAAVLAGALAAAYPPVSSAEPQSAKATTGKVTKKPAAKEAVVPPPIAVEVVAVDPKAKTITVREIAVAPAQPGKPLEVKLAVPVSATGQKLSDTKAGEQVSVTCAVKPTVHPTAGVPIVLTDCVRVIKIEPKS
jgi:hypothetical protein